MIINKVFIYSIIILFISIFIQYYRRKLKKNIRNTYIYERMSGDKFVIYLQIALRKKVMESLRNELNKNNDERFVIDLSYGICQINEYEEVAVDEIAAMDEMFIEAYKEMYED